MRPCARRGRRRASKRREGKHAKERTHRRETGATAPGPRRKTRPAGSRGRSHSGYRPKAAARMALQSPRAEHRFNATLSRRRFQCLSPTKLTNERQRGDFDAVKQVVQKWRKCCVRSASHHTCVLLLRCWHFQGLGEPEMMWAAARH